MTSYEWLVLGSNMRFAHFLGLSYTMINDVEIKEDMFYVAFVYLSRCLFVRSFACWYIPTLQVTNQRQSSPNFIYR